jgi:hypothetical protein
VSEEVVDAVGQHEADEARLVIDAELAKDPEGLFAPIETLKSDPSINVEIIVTLPDGTKKSENWEYEDLDLSSIADGGLTADIMSDVGDFIEDQGIFDDIELDDEDDEDEDDEDEDEDDDEDDGQDEDEDEDSNEDEDASALVAHDAAVGLPGEADGYIDGNPELGGSSLEPPRVGESGIDHPLHADPHGE